MVGIDIRRLAFWLLLLTITLLAATRAQADEGVRITLTPDSSELAVGDPVQMTVEVNHPAGYQVIIPQLEAMWGDFEVRSQSQATTVANDDGTATTQQVIEVTLFDLGEFQTPELPLTISDGAGQVREESAPPVRLTVRQTLAEDDTELRDIKPQAGLTVPPVWPWIAGGLVVVSAVAVAGWWAYRRWRGEPFGLRPAVDSRTPWQVAYDELARIEGLGLLEAGRFKEYYTLVTDCMRAYLENQFHLRVFDRTTSELKPVLRQSDLPPDHSRRILALFMEGDLVKFAKLTPDLESARQATVEARSLVDLTRPGQDLEAAIEDEAPVAPVTARRFSYQSGQ
jgi:uncharacterized membrane protein (DUF2068 family)